MAGAPRELNKADMVAANAQRMVIVMSRLGVLLSKGYKSFQQIEQPLLGLARGIDFSVVNGDVPSKASELRSLVKQICLWKGDDLLLPSIMVLMVSMKAACQLGWFSDADTREIINLYKEISSSFSLPRTFDDAMNQPNPHIQTIMDRFYPQLSLGKTLACLEVKPGYGAYLVDFHISKNAGFSPQEMVRLFVAQTDTNETSSCLISPQQANFLLNGNGVAGRVYPTLDTGPQIPTNITPMLKFGTNLLQVVGHFHGNYVIAIAFMGLISFSIPNLEYVQLDYTSQDSDSDVIMGPSRVCLNCPISRKRIKTPVKGQSCKHVQCFDLDNYVEINSRRPSWRCPHCNQHISFLDIRVDHNMTKVLNVVDNNAEDVIIYPDGLWKNTPKSNDDASSDINSNHLQGSDAADILDLTIGRDIIDTDQIPEFEDRKPSQADLLNPSGSSVEMQADFNMSNEANESRSSRMDADFLSGLDLSGYTLEPSNDGFENHSMTSTYYPTECALGPQSHLSSLCRDHVPVQQSLSVNSAMDDQHAGVALVPPNITRAPVAVQTLAATSGAPNSRLTSGATPASVISSDRSSRSSPSIALNADGSTTTMNSEVERLREYSRSVMNRLQLPEMNLHLRQRHSMAQSRDALRSFIHDSSTYTAASVSTSQISNAQRMPSVHQAGHQNRLNQLPQQPVRYRTMSAGMVQTRPLLLGTNYQQLRAGNRARSSPNLEGIPVRQIVTSHPAFQPLGRQTASASQNQTLQPGQLYPADLGAPGVSVQHPQGAVQQVSRAENLVNLPADTSARPAGRMRGSLSGRAYENAFNKFMSPAIQATEGAPRPHTSPPADVPPELREMITNHTVPDSNVSNQ